MNYNGGLAPVRDNNPALAFSVLIIFIILFLENT